ncbi:MAG: hypothetical protein GF350_06120, partial [Chitinivibrionales bacterium]|nr:hypothetical protein [Chitinivibrionales bacterium]
MTLHMPQKQSKTSKNIFIRASRACAVLTGGASVFLLLLSCGSAFDPATDLGGQIVTDANPDVTDINANLLFFADTLTVDTMFSYRDISPEGASLHNADAEGRMAVGRWPEIGEEATGYFEIIANTNNISGRSKIISYTDSLSAYSAHVDSVKYDSLPPNADSTDSAQAKSVSDSILGYINSLKNIALQPLGINICMKADFSHYQLPGAALAELKLHYLDSGIDHSHAIRLSGLSGADTQTVAVATQDSQLIRVPLDSIIEGKVSDSLVLAFALLDSIDACERKRDSVNKEITADTAHDIDSLSRQKESLEMKIDSLTVQL